jgi:hypothetical protein
VFRSLALVWSLTVGDSGNGPRFKGLNWCLLTLTLVSLVAIVLGETYPSTFYNELRGYFFVLPWLLFVFTFVGPVLRLAREERDKAIRIVVFWGLIGLLLFVVSFVAAYSQFAPTGGSADYDRLLNIVPAVIAVWVAGLGWYMQHQIAMKSHRTNHAFNLVMQTRTSGEYLRAVRAFQRVYAGRSIPPEDEKFFNRSAMGMLPDLEKKLRNPSLPEIEREVVLEEIAKLEAGTAAKYLLNYFEFVARGIAGGDLDEKIIYDTIAPSIITIFSQSEALCAHHRKTQRLGMSFLRVVVSDWEKRKMIDEANAPKSTD